MKPYAKVKKFNGPELEIFNSLRLLGTASEIYNKIKEAEEAINRKHTLFHLLGRDKYYRVVTSVTAVYK